MLKQSGETVRFLARSESRGTEATPARRSTPDARVGSAVAIGAGVADRDREWDVARTPLPILQQVRNKSTPTRYSLEILEEIY